MGMANRRKYELGLLALGLVHLPQGLLVTLKCCWYLRYYRIGGLNGLQKDSKQNQTSLQGFLTLAATLMPQAV